MRRISVLALSLSAMVTLSACGGGGDPMDAPAKPSSPSSPSDMDGTGGDDASATSAGDAAGGDPGSVIVASANFPENVLLAEIYAAALSDAGVDVTKKLNIGSRETYIAGLEDGSIDLIPEYTGGLATYLNPEITATSSEDVLKDAQDNLPADLQLLDISQAEDKDSLVVTKETADKLGLASIADLKDKAADLVLGGPPEFETRPNGVDGLKTIYGLDFKKFRSLAAGSNLTVQALKNGQVDVANIFTTDPAVGENGFVVLDDPESLFAAQNIVPLITKDAVNPAVEEALNGVSAALDTDILTQMMVKVVSDGQDPADVAREFVDGM
ncbi:MAG: ABC transporter substrate-binding protein [Ornithinimicrobium sp.]|uniref:ABC transporter substrate-binding protein n=1 Tax=Ornithinimicrobium sp. TaxID=1977084 RepID=UPI0026E0864C|nr:ABC transporter substrate-binding protein [Ornithinimicrobium sp.]MDO5740744.1 ABC transporter substrate-binding protein [Ornithinimicrobium sp.]